MNWSALLPLVGVPVIRSVAGWIQNSLKDGVIDRFEWAKLGETVVRVGIIGGAAYLGLNGFGINITAISAAAGALVLDLILKALEKRK